MFDSLVIGYILISCLFDFWRGFIGSFLSVNKWIAIILCTPVISPFFTPYVKNVVLKDPLASYVTIFIVFIVLLAITSIIVNLITSGFHTWYKSSVDRSIGALFGLIKSWSFVLLFFFLLISTLGCIEIKSNGKHANIHYLDNKMPKWLQTANLLPSLEITLNMAVGVLPYSTVKELYDMAKIVNAVESGNNPKNIVDSGTNTKQVNSESENSKIDRVQNKLNNGNNNADNSAQSSNVVPSSSKQTTGTTGMMQGYIQAFLNFIQTILNNFGINLNVTQDTPEVTNVANVVNQKLQSESRP